MEKAHDFVATIPILLFCFSMVPFITLLWCMGKIYSNYNQLNEALNLNASSGVQTFIPNIANRSLLPNETSIWGDIPGENNRTINVEFSFFSIPNLDNISLYGLSNLTRVNRNKQMNFSRNLTISHPVFDYSDGTISYEYNTSKQLLSKIDQTNISYFNIVGLRFWEVMRDKSEFDVIYQAFVEFALRINKNLFNLVAINLLLKEDYDPSTTPGLKNRRAFLSQINIKDQKQQDDIWNETVNGISNPSNFYIIIKGQTRKKTYDPFKILEYKNYFGISTLDTISMAKNMIQLMEDKKDEVLKRFPKYKSCTDLQCGFAQFCIGVFTSIPFKILFPYDMGNIDLKSFTTEYFKNRCDGIDKTTDISSYSYLFEADNDDDLKTSILSFNNLKLLLNSGSKIKETCHPSQSDISSSFREITTTLKLPSEKHSFLLYIYIKYFYNQVIMQNATDKQTIIFHDYFQISYNLANFLKNMLKKLYRTLYTFVIARLNYHVFLYENLNFDCAQLVNSMFPKAEFNQFLIKRACVTDQSGFELSFYSMVGWYIWTDALLFYQYEGLEKAVYYLNKYYPPKFGEASTIDIKTLSTLYEKSSLLNNITDIAEFQYAANVPEIRDCRMKYGKCTPKEMVISQWLFSYVTMHPLINITMLPKPRMKDWTPDLNEYLGIVFDSNWDDYTGIPGRFEYNMNPLQYTEKERNQILSNYSELGFYNAYFMIHCLNSTDMIPGFNNFLFFMFRELVLFLFQPNLNSTQFILGGYEDQNPNYETNFPSGGDCRVDQIVYIDLVDKDSMGNIPFNLDFLKAGHKVYSGISGASGLSSSQSQPMVRGYKLYHGYPYLYRKTRQLFSDSNIDPTDNETEEIKCRLQIEQIGSSLNSSSMTYTDKEQFQPFLSDVDEISIVDDSVNSLTTLDFLGEVTLTDAFKDYSFNKYEIDINSDSSLFEGTSFENYLEIPSYFTFPCYSNLSKNINIRYVQFDENCTCNDFSYLIVEPYSGYTVKYQKINLLSILIEPSILFNNSENVLIPFVLINESFLFDTKKISTFLLKKPSSKDNFEAAPQYKVMGIFFCVFGLLCLIFFLILGRTFLGHFAHSTIEIQHSFIFKQE